MLAPEALFAMMGRQIGVILRFAAWTALPPYGEWQRAAVDEVLILASRTNLSATRQEMDASCSSRGDFLADVQHTPVSTTVSNLSDVITVASDRSL